MLPYDPDLALRIYRYKLGQAEARRPAVRTERQRAGVALLRALKSRLMAVLAVSPVGQIRRRPA